MERPPAWLSPAASGCIIAVVAGIVGVPLVGAGGCVIAPTDALGVAGLDATLDGGRLRGLLGQSLLLATLASAGACLVGSVLGFSFWGAPARGRHWLAWLLVLPLALPPTVIGVGALWVLGPAGVIGIHLPWNLTKGLGGPAALLCMTYAPLVALLVWGRLAGLAPGLLEAARLAAGPWKVRLRILLPLCGASIACGGMLVFLLSLFNYTLPSLCRQNVLAVELLLRCSAYFDLWSAALVSLLLAVTGLLVLIALRAAMGRVAYPPEEGRRANAARGSAAGTVVVCAYVACAVGVPLWGHATRLPAVGDIPEILAACAPSVAFTAIVGVCGGALAAGLGAVWAAQVEFGRVVRGTTAELCGILPLALPVPLLGVGLLYALNRPGPSVLLDGGQALMWAYGVAGFPYACLLVLTGMRLVPREEREAFALVRRASPALLAHFVLRRLAVPTACAFFACVCMSLGESDCALLLAPPGQKPLPVKIYTLYHFGAPGDVAVLSYALSALTIAVAAAGFAVVQGVCRRRGGTREAVHE